MTRRPASDRPARSAHGAPHVRAAGDLGSLTRTFLVALAPCFVFALYNTGFQANRALAELGRAPTGWRGTLLAALGTGHDPGDALACVAHGALVLLPLLAVSYAAATLWERLFARVRGRERQPGVGLLAVLFVLALPATLPLWQAALGMSFGIVVGREVFGGAGRYVAHPVVVALAFLAQTYPDQMRGDAVWVAVDGYASVTALGAGVAGGPQALAESGLSWTQAFVGRVPGAMGTTSALACLLGALVLVIRRAVSWRILLGLLGGVAGASWLLAQVSAPAIPAASLPWHGQLVLGNLAFAGVFLATDPVTAPATQAGRWVGGVLIGALVVLIRVGNPTQEDGAILAVLLANVFAPLVDHAVVRLHVAARARRLAAAGAAR